MHERLIREVFASGLRSERVSGFWLCSNLHLSEIAVCPVF